MVQFRFRLTGVPPDQAIKLIECDPNYSVAEVKKSVQKEYHLNPILGLAFIYKGKVLPDTIKFAKIGIHPRKDVITVMALQAGGACACFCACGGYCSPQGTSCQEDC